MFNFVNIYRKILSFTINVTLNISNEIKENKKYSWATVCTKRARCYIFSPRFSHPRKSRALRYVWKKVGRIFADLYAGNVENLPSFRSLLHPCQMAKGTQPPSGSCPPAISRFLRIRGESPGVSTNSPNSSIFKGEFPEVPAAHSNFQIG